MLKWIIPAVCAVAYLSTPAGAQVVNPDIEGPARRAVGAAADALGAPAVNQRIEQRQELRDVERPGLNPDAATRPNPRVANPLPADQWRYRYHNDQWWYYTPENSWMYYRNDAWSPYDASTYVVPPRYTTGYRGPVIVDTPAYRVERRGVFGRRVYTSPYGPWR